MDIRAFGRLTVTNDGESVPITRQKCRALLALLISHYPNGLSPDAIADALWPDADFERAANSVRVHATYLRRALSCADGVIPRTDGRYRLNVEPDEIDVQRFERLSLDARSVAGSGDPSGACAIYEAAIAEWRGAPFQDWRDLPALRNEIVRIESLRLDTLEGFATALLDDERQDQVCRLLEPIIDDQLIRETLAARLMLALYRTGRQQDALGLFGKVKRALSEGLGLLPSNQLQGLADMIVMHDAELGVGDASPTPRVLDQPRRRSEFIGRAKELQALEGAWRRAAGGAPQLAYVAGVAGIGKSTVVARFADGVRGEGAQVFQGACDPDPVD
ncbi:MAG: AAA family ATPase, partial [Acidimicrobiia bacterium]|nr:AAA family ATPase [Acidimicrobiia bacterium]